MYLFEITTGREDCAYERAYCWAPNVSMAEDLFLKANKGSVIHRCIPILHKENKPFCTKVSYEGWVKR